MSIEQEFETVRDVLDHEVTRVALTRIESEYTYLQRHFLKDVAVEHQRDALKAALEEIVKVESQSWESIAVYAQNVSRQALKELEEK